MREIIICWLASQTIFADSIISQEKLDWANCNWVTVCATRMSHLFVCMHVITITYKD